MATPVKNPAKPVPTATRKSLVSILNKENYVILGIGLLLLIVGYTVMSGGQQKPEVWDTKEIYSFTRITVAPILVVLGYITVGLGIMWHSKEARAENK